MGFLTRFLAGLTAAAALGTGLAGTANAVDVTGAAGTTKSVVKLADDGTSNLPDHLVNGDFEYPVKSDMPVNDGNFWYISQNDGSYFANGTVLGKRYKLPEGFDKAKFAWHSTQTGDTYYPDLERADDVQVDYTADGTNHYSEISAAQSGATIYQDVATVPGVMYKWSLKHASLDSSHLDKMSVIIGEPGKETAQEATRTTANGHGDKLGKVGTVISTKVSNPEMPAGNKFQEGAHTGQWETYTGTYIATGTVTRFAFRSVEGYSAWDGNLLDDISFSKAYKLTYDKNASDATGSVPSDTTANTVKQAKADATGTVKTVTDTKTKTSGTVKTVADTNASLPDHLVNGDFSVNYHDQWKDSFGGWTSIDPNAGKTLHATSLPNGSSWKWTAINGWDKSKFGWTSTQKAGSNVQQKANAVELQYDDSTADNVYAELCAYEAGTAIYQDIRTVPGTLYKVRLKHASLNSTYLDKMQVMIGTPGHEQPVEMTRTTVNGHGDKLNEKSTTIATKVTNGNNRHHADQWETYEGTYLIPDGQTTTRFTFKSIDAKQLDYGNVLDDIVFDKAYRLDYDKNASDATGKVPSNQRGKENTVQPAKAKTTGTVRLASDDKNGLPTELVNGSFQTYGNEVINKRTRQTSLFMNFVDGNGNAMQDLTTTPWTKLPDWNAAKFGWKSTDSVNGHSNLVELQRPTTTKRPSTTSNVWAEIAAATQGKYIYQDIATTPGVMYKWSLRHASRNTGADDTMQVLIGEPGKETAQQAIRDTSNGSDKTGNVGVDITTHGTSQNGQWETYTGTYIATSTVTRFTFKSVVDSNHRGDADSAEGNCIDDVMFTKAYRLSYDKNATDANGSVPSDETSGATKQAKAGTTGTVRLASDDDVATYAASNLPKQIVNSDFDHDWRNIVSQSKMSAKYNFANIDPAHGDVEISGALNSKGEASKQWVHLNGFDANKFGWKSNQTDTKVDGRGGIVEIQRSRANDNMYAEITASQANTYLYQDIDTAHDYPTVYTVKLRYAHRNGTINSNEKIQILVGAPGHEQPVEMTRIASDRGNRLGEKSTTVNAPNTDGWLGSWDTFQGSVVVPAGQDVSRFTFKALGSIDGISGNLIDDVQFKLAYKLSYDKNANDAYGQVPSDTTANTVKQAKTRTTGTVRAVADRTASGLTVHDLKKGDIAPAQYGDFKFSTTDRFTAEQVTDVNDFTVKQNWDPTKEDQAYADKNLATMYQPNKNGASLILHHVGQWCDSSGTQQWLNAKITVNGQNLGSLVYYESQHKFLASYGKWDRHTSSRPYMDVTVDFLLDDGSTPQGLRGVTGFTDLDGGTSGYNEGVELVSGFDGAYVRSDAHLARFGTNGWAGATDENENNADAHGMKHYVGATFTGSSFRVRCSVASGQARGSGFQPVDSTIAYRLTYNKNAQDATGSIPSDTAANTTRPAKSETDGKVSDLVQRTTTHEDGSVTVKTIDTSTDVVSGCQVYYPAGQRITLATMAKDDDCWDSSMLSRPGHTQLGWNQDRNATQAQAQVTMVEGGMTVYAVWVGNPVLTYDTNKPATWSGQMPSTPASVSVAYNTAAADGSGWRAGDVSKIRGYRFLGWYTGPQDNAGLYDWTRPLTGNVTVYAHWQRLQANVIYNANGGTGSHANTTGWQYSDVTIPGDTSKSFTRDGYVFKGWSLKAGKADVVYKDGSQIPLQDKDITLYAQWQGIHENFTETGGISLPLLIAGGIGLLVMGVGSTVMLTRRMNGHGMPDGE